MSDQDDYENELHELRNKNRGLESSLKKARSNLVEARAESLSRKVSIDKMSAELSKLSRAAKRIANR